MYLNYGCLFLLSCLYTATESIEIIIVFDEFFISSEKVALLALKSDIHAAPNSKFTFENALTIFSASIASEHNLATLLPAPFNVLTQMIERFNTTMNSRSGLTRSNFFVFLVKNIF